MNDDLQQLLTAAARLFRVERAFLVIRCRFVRVAHARQAVAYALRARHPELSTAEIARLMGQDRSTIAYALRAVTRRIHVDAAYAATVAALIAAPDEELFPPAPSVALPQLVTPSHALYPALVFWGLPNVLVA